MEYTLQKLILKQQKGNRRGREEPCGVMTDKIDYEITQEDVEKTINSLKNRKAAGPDNITNEMLKYGGPMNQREVTTFLKKVLYTGVTPQVWKTSIIISIFKKGQKKNPNNYRRIKLLRLKSSKIQAREIELIQHKNLQQHCNVTTFYIAMQCCRDIAKSFSAILLQQCFKNIVKK